MAFAEEGRKWIHPIPWPDAMSFIKDAEIENGAFFLCSDEKSSSSMVLAIKYNNEPYAIPIRVNKERCKYILGHTKIVEFNNLIELVINIIQRNLLLTPTTGGPLFFTTVVHSNIPRNRWFIPNGNLELVERKLSWFKMAHCFAVWNKAPMSFILTIRERNRIIHIPINYSKTKYFIESFYMFPSIKELVENYISSDSSIPFSGGRYKLGEPFQSTRFFACYIENRINDLMMNFANDSEITKIAKEFEELGNRSLRIFYSNISALQLQNISKNRYKNVLADDRTRVVLKESETDYINANFVTAKHQVTPPCYIFCQGPLGETLDDHWKMILHEGVEVIVVLTKLVEKGIVKCIKYWPDQEETMVLSFGLQLELESIESTPEIVTRTIKVTLPGSTFLRMVKIIHFMVWPDFGVPNDPMSILALINHVNKIRRSLSQSPMIIHCSAGIGRTGTFAAIDMLLHEFSTKGLMTVLDVQKTVFHMRKFRANCVSTVEQYYFIYLTLATYIKSKLGSETL